jgi:hypothetical protein
MIFQRFSQNKYKRKGEKPPTKQPGRSYVRFEKMGGVMSGFQFMEEKLTFVIVEENKVDFFMTTLGYDLLGHF